MVLLKILIEQARIKFHKNSYRPDIRRLAFTRRLEPCISLVERIDYNEKTGRLWEYSYFATTYGKKLYIVSGKNDKIQEH